ncbi:MAG: hypothetical protein JRM80_05100 [Nitrososphaerota archaeon]|nr:hypothetical protein [Nitrososphaerota archaeon]
MVDFLSTLLGAIVGVAGASIASYVAFFARPRSSRARAAVREPEGTASRLTIPAPSLERSRREMRALMVERDLLSSALMKVYEAETDGRITKEEREMIAKKYSDQIKDLQSKLKDVELVVEVGELEGLREELVTMFQEKIQHLETRLDQARERLEAAAPQLQAPSAVQASVRKETPPKAERPTELEKAVEKKAKPEMSESEKRRKEITSEVMEALTKLERIDVEKKQQET